jgi:hypothetical protein
MFLNSALLVLVLCFASLWPVRATPVPKAVEEFVQRAVPADWLGFHGSVFAGSTTYYLFSAEQGLRTGSVLVSDWPELKLVGADIALSSFHPAASSAIANPVLESCVSLLRCNPVTLKGHGHRPICLGSRSLGEALNQFVSPIAHFTFTAKTTNDILEQLRESDAIPIDPLRAPPGAILIAPTRCSSQGPVSLGTAGILGPDHWVYGPDGTAMNRWARLAPSEAWIRELQLTNGVFAFVLRAGGSSFSEGNGLAR